MNGDEPHPNAIDDPDVYRSLVEGIPAILYIDRPDDLSTNFYTSPQAVDLLGFSQEEWLSDPVLWHKQLHPEDSERWNLEFAPTVAEGTSIETVNSPALSPVAFGVHVARYESDP